jgi:hypothetical protein
VEEAEGLALGFPGAGGFHPADLAARLPVRAAGGDQSPAPAVQALVPVGLRPRLGLDGPPSEAAPDEVIELLLPARRLDLGQCLDVPRGGPGVPTKLAVAFVVEPDGTAGAVRAAAGPAAEALESCAAGVAAGWEFPTSDGRVGPFAVVIDVEPFPGGVAPVYAGSLGLRPTPRNAACLAAPVQRMDGPASASRVVLKLAVDTSGRPVLVHPLTAAPEPVIAAAVGAVRGCAWNPGAGPDGHPAPMWTTATVTVVGR